MQAVDDALTIRYIRSSVKVGGADNEITFDTSTRNLASSGSLRDVDLYRTVGRKSTTLVGY